MAGRLIGRTLALLLARYEFKSMHTNFFRGLAIWIFALIGIIMGLNILGLKALAASLVAGGGITAVILGFAFREIGENFLAGFFLAFSRPFEVGNFIQSGEFQGVVKSIEMRSTHIRTADGRDIFIPSSQIFNNALVNFTKDGLRRLSFTVGIDYGDDSEKARNLLLEMAKDSEGVLADPIPAANIYSLDANYVILEITFWVDTFIKGIDLLKIKNELMEKSRRTLAANGFTFSSNVTTNVALGGYQPLDIRLNR
jgi:small-conductance mechanosensitive channel